MNHRRKSASALAALGCVLGAQTIAQGALAEDAAGRQSQPYVIEVQGARFELDTLHRTGAVLDDDQLLESKRAEPSRAAAAALPTAIDLTAGLPMPGDQGGQGSCVAWAVGYATKSYHEVNEIGWSPNLRNHQFSPSWIYNQLNGGEDKGLAVSDALDLIVDRGADTLSNFPYTDTNFTNQPDAASFGRAAQFKAKRWQSLDNQVRAIKEVLASGNTVIAAFNVFPDFDALNGTNNTLYDTAEGTTSKCSSPPCKRGSHAVALIGYDDERQAFKLVNSWGSSWGSSGYGWLAYDFVDESDLNLRAYCLEDDANQPARSAMPAGRPYGYDGGGATRIVYRGNDSHVHELSMTSDWAHWDMNEVPGAAAAAGDPMGFVAGVPRVLYRGVDGHVHELSLTDRWNHFDFSGLPGMVSAAGNPFGYVDARGAARIVFRGTDRHIHEIFQSNGWQTWDMNALPGAVDAAGDPMGFVSNGGVPRVLYRGVDGHVHEFNMTDRWATFDFNGLSGMVLAAGNPFGYVDAGGTVRIDFRGVDQHIHEIWLSNRWNTFDLNGVPGMVLAAGDPVGYVGGSATRIVFRGVDRHIHELNLTDHWSHFDMFGVAGFEASSDPIGRSVGGAPRVDYLGADGHLHENWLLNGWHDFDFSGLLLQ
jgi:hypothetical protein